jgi:hypothetical protein
VEKAAKSKPQQQTPKACTVLAAASKVDDVDSYDPVFDESTQGSEGPQEDDKMAAMPTVTHDAAAPALPAPAVGSMFRVQYEMNDESAHRVVPMWWLGTATDVRESEQRGKYKVNLFFDSASLVEKEDELDYPGIQMVEKDDKTGLTYVLSTSPDGSMERGDVVGDDNPKDFVVGDMVDALFQNGLDGDNWFRGRVARIDKKTNTCHIAYIDGDVSTTPVVLLSLILLRLTFVRLSIKTTV